MPNPLLQDWTGAYGLPPFADVCPDHFLPACELAMAEHRAEIDAMVGFDEPPDFANTILALERGGRRLRRIQLLFENLALAETSPKLEQIELLLSPRFAAHRSAIYLNSGLFARVAAVHRDRHDRRLSAEQIRLVERIFLDFVRAGAQLDAAGRQRYAEIVEELAALTTRFSQNVMADESGFQLPLNSEADLAGLPDFVRAAARQAAMQRGMTGHVVTLSRSLVVPFLTFSRRRDLRRVAYEAWLSRGEHPGAHDNREIAVRILSLRQEQARLHGCANYAEFVLADTMAKSPAAVYDLLHRVWAPAKQRAADEEADLRDMARTLGEPVDIEPWDWRYLAEKVRVARHDLDEAQLKPYFALDAMRQAMFDCAARLFGVGMVEVHGLTLYHPDVRAWEVHRDGHLIGIFLADDFARTSKRGGAWMSELRAQSRMDGEVIPIVINVNNFSRGEPTMLGFDDVRTLFHEFGHGLHGLLSNASYERLSGTNVLSDFVELPSQIMENWALEPEVLRRHARHVATGESIPQSLVERIRASEYFNKGFDTVEYLASALIDLALHEVGNPETLDLGVFEAEGLERLDMPPAIRMRHRLPHFGHIFGGDGYSARYYVYLWAEVLDADGFEAFKEAGDLFDRDVAGRLHRHVFSTGNTVEPGATYRAFRGRDPRVEPMLKARGLLDARA